MSSGRIQVPGQNRSEPNPLLVLATALDKTNLYLHQISINTAKEARHIYALGELGNGEWGSYCLACSDAAQEYIHPCAVLKDHPVPPSHISVVPVLKTS